jgi:hypothetical protein
VILINYGFSTGTEPVRKILESQEIPVPILCDHEQMSGYLKHGEGPGVRLPGSRHLLQRILALQYVGGDHAVPLVILGVQQAEHHIEPCIKKKSVLAGVATASYWHFNLK